MHSRNYPRASTEIGVTVRLNGVESGDGVSINLSAGGVAVATSATAEIGDRAEVGFAGGAALEGAVVRVFDGGFAMSFDLKDCARDRLGMVVDQMIVADSDATRLLLDRRAYARIPCPRFETTIRVANRDITCWVNDISLGGASVITAERLRIGDEVGLGVASGRVVSRRGGTYGVEFDGAAADGWG